jgi:O-antigen/teichoic acid export membrane protein
VTDGSGAARHVAGGLAWTVSSAFLQIGLQAVSLAVLGRLLTPADFGLVAAALVIVNFSAIFAQLGVNHAVVQRRELSTGVPGTSFLISMGIAVVLSGVVLAGAPLVASLMQLPAVTPILRALAAIFVVRALAATSEALMLRSLRFRATAIIEIVSYGIGYGGVGIALAAAGAGPWALVVGHLAQAVLKAGITLSVQRHALRPDLNPATVRSLLHFGGGHSLARIGNFVALQADNVVVARGLGAAPLGVYSRAYQLMGMPAGLFGNAIDRVLFPTFSRMQSERTLLRQAYLRGTALVAIATLPAGIVLVVNAPELVSIVLGAQWDAVVPPFQVFALTMALRVTDRLNAVVARSVAAVYRRAAIQGVYAVMVIALSLAGVPYGVRGVAVAVAAALVANHVLSTSLSLRLVGSSWRSVVTASAAAGPATIVAGAAALAASATLRSLGSPDALTLVVSLALVLMALAVATRRSPRLILGPEAAWTLRTLAAFLPARPAAIVRSLAVRAGGRP